MSKFIKNSTCCDDTVAETPGGQDCLDIWERELLIVTNSYNEKNATTFRSHEKYLNAMQWQQKIERWHGLVETADEKSKDIVAQLGLMIDFLNSVCTKTKCTNDSVDKIVCLVKSLFDLLYSYDEPKKGLIDQLESFKNMVECLQGLGDDKKEEILACIAVLEQNIETVLAKQNAILKKLIETLKLAHLLYEALCSDGAGLKVKIEIMKNILTGADPEEEEKCNYQGDEDDGDIPCDYEKAKPIPAFPISDGSYYKTIADLEQKAIQKTTELKTKWIEDKAISDGLLADRTGLAEAIGASKNAEGAK